MAQMIMPFKGGDDPNRDHPWHSYVLCSCGKLLRARTYVQHRHRIPYHYEVDREYLYDDRVDAYRKELLAYV